MVKEELENQQSATLKLSKKDLLQSTMQIFRTVRNIPKMLGVEDQDIMINEERHMMPVEAPSGLAMPPNARAVLTHLLSERPTKTVSNS